MVRQWVLQIKPSQTLKKAFDINLLEEGEQNHNLKLKEIHE